MISSQYMCDASSQGDGYNGIYGNRPSGRTVAASLWEAWMISSQYMCGASPAGRRLQWCSSYPSPRKPVAAKFSMFAHELFNLTYDTVEFLDEVGVIDVLPKCGHQSSVVPNGAVFFSTEPLEYFETVSSKLS